MPRPKHYEKTARAGTWISLGNENMVRLIDLDASRWRHDFDTTKYMIAHNHCGGLVAMYGKGIARMENCISLFSSSGQPHAAAPKIKLDKSQEVLFMCWNQVQDHLVVVLNDKTVRFFNYKGETVCSDIKLEANPLLFTPTDTGFASVSSYTGEQPVSLYLVHYKEREGYILRSVVLPTPFQKIVPTTSLLAVPEKYTETGFPDVFLPCLSTPIFSGVYRCVFTPQPKIWSLKLSIAGGAVLKMSLSPAGRCIALAMEDGFLYFGDRSLEEVVKSTERFEACTDLAWCGEHCVVCQSSPEPGSFEGDPATTVMVVNPDDPSFFDYIYDLPADLVLLPECDGIRLMSSDNLYQLLQVVTKEGQRVFSVGSRAMSAVLLCTYDEFMSGAAATAVTSIRDMRERYEDLAAAIDDCVSAAAAEFDYEQQKRLLRVAAFGKSFCPVYQSDHFVNTARRIRTRNTLESNSAGVCLSYKEMLELGDERLLRRLIQSNEHQVAHAVCMALELNPDEVLHDWALAKLSRVMARRPGPEEEKSYAKRIAAKIKRTEPTTSFAELARLANARGYRAAALAFLEAEPNALRQVPMLLTINEPDLALRQAVAAINSDLIFTAISHLLKSKGTNATPIIASRAESRAVLLEYMKVSESHRDVMVGFFNQHPEYQTALSLQTYFQEEGSLRKSLATARSVSELNWELLQECKSAAAQSLITSVRKEAQKAQKSSTPPGGSAFSPTSRQPPQSVTNEKFMRTHLSVIQDQTRLMRELDDPRFLTASVTDMVRFAFEHGRESVAAKLKAEYSIPEKLYQWCMLTAYSQTGQWDLIDDLGVVSSQTGPLISAEVFVTTLIAFGRLQQARQYIPRVSKIELRMEYYVQCGDWYAAAADCRKHSEHDLVAQLRDRAKGDSDILQQINDGWNSHQESTIKFSKLFSS